MTHYKTLKDYPKGVIVTGTGMVIDLQLPKLCDITIYDIANSISKIPRFNGRSRHFYSVAQHSVMVGRMVKEYCKERDQDYSVEALLHDAHEAYVHDVATPIKDELGRAYGRLEDRFRCAVGAKFGLMDGPEIASLIKRFDQEAAELEYQSLFLENDTPLVARMVGLGMYVGHCKWTHGFAYKQFMETYKDFTGLPF
jgi:hypothetical protein